MMTHHLRAVRSGWLKWLLLLIVAAMIAGVAWRLLPVGKQGGAMPAVGRGASLVHSGVATTADVPVWLNALGTVIPNASVKVTSRVDG